MNSFPHTELCIENSADWTRNGLHEIMVRKNRRRLKPELKYTITGLIQDNEYLVQLIVSQIDDNYYKLYKHDLDGAQQRAHVRRNKPRNPPLGMIHTDGWMTGREWMDNGIHFSNIFVSTNAGDSTFALETKVAYQLSIMIQSRTGESVSFHSSCQDFVAVSVLTKYNNNEHILNKRRATQSEEEPSAKRRALPEIIDFQVDQPVSNDLWEQTLTDEQFVEPLSGATSNSEASGAQMHFSSWNTTINEQEIPRMDCSEIQVNQCVLQSIDSHVPAPMDNATEYQFQIETQNLENSEFDYYSQEMPSNNFNYN